MKIVAKPIEMIAVFHPSGTPEPYKFRMTEDDGQRIVVKVDKILESEKSRIAGIECIIYRCQSIISGLERRYELKFVMSKCHWELYKI